MAMASGTATRRQFVQGAALGAAGIAAAGAIASPKAAKADEQEWDLEADVVVIGAGGSGLPAALKAHDDGASVIVVETNWDCGGHAMVSSGDLPIGGGTNIQKKFGIEDTTDQFYLDHTRGDYALSLYNDRTYERAITNVMPEVYDYLQEKGVVILDSEPSDQVETAWNGCDTVARWTHPDTSSGEWDHMFDKGENGCYVVRPLEKSARAEGIQFLMNYHMDHLFREDNNGRVYGLEASHTPHIFPGETEAKVNLMTDGNIDFDGDTCRIKANKGIVLATGGSMGNVNIRTAYDPRLGPEFDGLAGMPYSNADGSGEIAGMEVGCILGAMVNYAHPFGGHAMAMPRRLGCRYGYTAGYSRSSVIWPYAVATGVPRDLESMVIVNALGARCGNEDVAWNEKGDAFTSEFFNTALSSVIIDDPEVDGDARRVAGPLWVIFDQACADRNEWDMEQGTVDYDNGYCFKADTLEELAEAVVNKYYEDIKMDADTLVATVKAYNDCCDGATDEQWGRTTFVNKIETGPFYAAWSTCALHDCYGGLRVNGDMQCVDIHGELIPGLFACGESSGGVRTHGLSRSIPSGYIAGASAAAGGSEGDAGVSAPEGWAEMAVYGGAPEAKAESTYDASVALKDGVYAGTSPRAHDGDLDVEVTVEGGVITNVEVTKQNETPGIGGQALPKLIDEVLDQQVADVDIVGGASMTSAAFIEAMKDALSQAQA